MPNAVSSPPWRGLAGLALVLAALLATAAVRLLSGDAAVTDADLAAAMLWLQERRQGAVIVVHPPWRDDVASRLREGLAGADVRLAAPLHQGSPAGRLLLVEAGWSPGPGAFASLVAHDELRAGALRLRLFVAAGEAPAATTGRSLVLDDLRGVRARIEFADRVVTCDDFDAAAQRYRCPSLPEWNHVGSTTLVIAGKPTRCLWAHPITDGRLRIDLPWPNGVSRVSVLHGLADTAASAPGGKDVVLEVLADDRSLARYTQRNEVGLSSHALALDQGAPAERLVLVVTTPGDGARHFCIDLRVEAEPSAAPASPVRPLLRPLAPGPSTAPEVTP